MVPGTQGRLLYRGSVEAVSSNGFETETLSLAPNNCNLKN